MTGPFACILCRAVQRSSAVVPSPPLVRVLGATPGMGRWDGASPRLSVTQRLGRLVQFLELPACPDSLNRHCRLCTKMNKLVRPPVALHFPRSILYSLLFQHPCKDFNETGILFGNLFDVVQLGLR